MARLVSITSEVLRCSLATHTATRLNGGGMVRLLGETRAIGKCLETLVREVGIRVRTHISGIRLLVNPLDHSDIKTPGSYKQNYLTFENIPQYDRLLFNFKSVALQFYSHREQVYK